MVTGLVNRNTIPKFVKIPTIAYTAVLIPIIAISIVFIICSSINFYLITIWDSLFRKIISKISLEIPSHLDVPDLFFNTFESPIPDKKAKDKTIKDSAAYLLITQLIFYQILSETHINLPKIQIECLNHDVLTKVFEEAQKIVRGKRKLLLKIVPEKIELLDYDFAKKGYSRLQILTL